MPLPWQPLCHIIMRLAERLVLKKQEAYRFAGGFPRLLPGALAEFHQEDSRRGDGGGARDLRYQLKSRVGPDGSIPPGPRPSTAQGLNAGVKGQGSRPRPAGPSEPGTHPPLLGATALRSFMEPQLGRPVGKRKDKTLRWSAQRCGSVTDFRPPTGVKGSEKLRGACRWHGRGR